MSIYDIIMNSTTPSGDNMSHDQDVSQHDYPRVIKYKPLWEIIVKALFYVPVIILAVIGNVIIIAVVAKNKRMQVSLYEFGVARCVHLFSQIVVK